MTQLRTLCRNLTLALLLFVLLPAARALAAGDDKTTTITSTDTNVKVQLLLSKKDPKGRTLPPIDVPPSSDGHTFKIEPQLFGSTTALPDGLYPYDCGDGKIVFVVPGANIDDVCPKDQRKPLAYIPLGGSGTISSLPDGITHLLTITSGGMGAGAIPASGQPLTLNTSPGASLPDCPLCPTEKAAYDAAQAQVDDLQKSYDRQDEIVRAASAQSLTTGRPRTDKQIQDETTLFDIREALEKAKANRDLRLAEFRICAAQKCRSGAATVTVPPSRAPQPSHFRIGGEVGGKVGAKHYSGVNTCGMLQATAPGGTCSASSYAPQFGVYGGITFGNHLGAFASYNYALDINRNGSLATGTERSSFGTQFETITGQLKAPIGPVTPFLEGGIAFLQNRLNENVTLGPGSSSSPLSTHFNINLTTYTAGGGVRIHDSKHWGVGLYAQYMPAQKHMLLNEHNITGGAFLLYKIGK